jgi:hypothetical protein
MHPLTSARCLFHECSSVKKHYDYGYTDYDEYYIDHVYLDHRYITGYLDINITTMFTTTHQQLQSTTFTSSASMILPL